MGKFKARYIVIPLIVLAAGGGIFGWTKAKNSEKIIKVAPVSAAADVYYTDLSSSGDTFYGKLKKGSFINVKVSPELKIQSVNFKKGDIVRKGDVLISYDTHSLKDSVEDAELLVKTLKNNIQIVDNELDVLKRLQPSENAPQEEEEEEPQNSDTDSDSTPDQAPKSKYEARITKTSIPLAGIGTAEDPFIYIAGQTSVVSKELLSELSGKTAVFYVCTEDDMQLFAKLIDGSKIDAASVQDYPLMDGVTVTPDGMIAFGGSSVDFASFLTMSAAAPQNPGDYTLPDNYYDMSEIPQLSELPEGNANASAEITLDDNYKFSAQELRDMIKEKEKSKADLDLQERQAELNVKKAKKLAQTGGEVATIDGKVTFVAKDIKHLSESGAYMTVNNDSGMSVTATVGEFSLDKVAEGMAVDITNYETGTEGTGTVTYINPEPSSQVGSGESNNGSLESQYEFTVTLDNDMEIGADSEVQLVVRNNDGTEGCVMPTSLIRTEGSRSYVLIKGEDGRLEKRYVKVGKKEYETALVTEGITGDDMICFPYGKAKVGSETVDTDFDSMYYDFGLFY